jgi:hypothetical protein
MSQHGSSLTGTVGSPDREETDVRTTVARRVTSTACAAVALALTLGGSALAAPPVCTAPPPQTVVEGTQLILSGPQYCPDPRPLVFTVGAASHGMTLAQGDFFGYGPDAGYTGPDAFELTASAGTETSAPVTVTVTVTENQPPTCPATRRLHFLPDTPGNFNPYEGCLDDVFLFRDPEVADEPDHGALSPPDPIFRQLLYTPEAGYEGMDAFTLVLKDHLEEAAQVVFEVLIGPNRAPTCVTPVALQVPVDGRLPLDHRNACSDPDGDAISPEVVTFPSNGHFEGVPPAVEYVPDPGYSGTDRIVYRVRDVLGAPSNDAVVDITVGDPSDDPPEDDPPAQQPPQQQPKAQAAPPDLDAPTFALSRAAPQRLAAVRRNGLKLRLASDEAGTATIALTVSKRTARRLKIDRKASGPVVVGQTTKTLQPGDNDVVVRFTHRARRRLAGARRVAISVIVTGRDAAGNTTRETLTVTLRR